jgi:hypothetical protein
MIDKPHLTLAHRLLGLGTVIARVHPNGWVAPPGLAPRVAAG